MAKQSKKDREKIEQHFKRHLVQIRKDFEFKDNIQITLNSKLKNYEYEEIVELPKILDGYLQPCFQLTISNNELVVQHRLKIMPENGSNHDIILKIKTYKF